jgi:alcohol dehydrogenase class IV
MRDYKVPLRSEGGPLVVAIPTTAGTGLETWFTANSDTETDEKMLIAGFSGCRGWIAAIVDYELTLTMPLKHRDTA